MFLAAQYYRPPFPDRSRWADDMSRMRDAGLHAVQLWCLWGWIEAEPGVYRYDDYDELVTLAEKRGLQLVLSSIGELQPFWIHRLVPGSEMVDHLGRTVISVPRIECNVGLTPGGCTDNPKVAQLMSKFLTDLAARYAGAASLAGWDAWNETRWAVHADGRVCYCRSTLRAFRSWLDRRYGGLAGLSDVWKRRYVSWDDVVAPKRTAGPYCDNMDFLRFLIDRASEHARMRYRALRAGDPRHLIIAHCAAPAVQSAGWENEQALSRGVDWDLADELDGWGCSHFPFGGGFDEEDFGVRVESTRSACRGKVAWVSELQGGSARWGLEARASVAARPQQRWVANGMARGCKAVIFWCWRDEVFGPESSGFGLCGFDGLTEERLSAMKAAAKFIDDHMKLIDAYRPDEPRVGVLFSPASYLLDWADAGRALRASDSVVGYAKALERLGIPYSFVEAGHLDVLEGLDVLLMPWALSMPAAAERAVARFLRRGGRILAEAETAAYDEAGFYRYPDERPFMKALGIQDLGRRELAGATEITAELGERAVDLAVTGFTTPLRAAGRAEVLAANAADEPLLVRKAVGKGAAFVVGSFLGQAYMRQRSDGLEALIRWVCNDAGTANDFALTAGDGREGLVWRSGPTTPGRLLWIINSGPERDVLVADRARRFGRARSARELTTGRRVPIETDGGGKQCSLSVPAGGFAVLHWR